jgi:hypothetical protein
MLYLPSLIYILLIGREMLYLPSVIYILLIGREMFYLPSVIYILLIGRESTMADTTSLYQSTKYRSKMAENIL